MIYDSLHTIPIKIYHRVLETKDYSLLEYESLSDIIQIQTLFGFIVKLFNKLFTKKIVLDLEIGFEKISSERLDTFGVSDTYRRIFFTQKDLNSYEIRLLEGDESVRPFISDCETKIQLLLNQMGGDDSDLSKSHARERMIVEKETGCNIEKMSAFDFYTHLNDINERYKNQEMEDFTKNRVRRAS